MSDKTVTDAPATGTPVTKDVPTDEYKRDTSLIFAGSADSWSPEMSDLTDTFPGRRVDISLVVGCAGVPGQGIGMAKLDYAKVAGVKCSSHRIEFQTLDGAFVTSNMPYVVYVNPPERTDS